MGRTKKKAKDKNNNKDGKEALETVAEMGLALTQSFPNGSKATAQVSVEVVDGVDAAHAAFHFCDAYALPGTYKLSQKNLFWMSVFFPRSGRVAKNSEAVTRQA